MGTKTMARFTRSLTRFAAATLAALLFAGPVLADVAPPAMPPGSNIGPDATTNVAMRSERIEIQVVARQVDKPQNLTSDVAAAHVVGQFHMRNLGTTEERLQVRFPLADPSGEGSGFFTYPEVQNFAVGVDGQAVPTTTVELPNPYDEKDPAVRWAAFDVTFPVTREVLITVSYDIEPTGYFPEAVFAYVLSTGAGWRGPIGKVDIVARLPYPATSENVVMSNTARGAKITRGEVRWQWRNLEPTNKNDIYFTVLTPNVWQAIVDARAAQKRAPRDAAKWVALAWSYVAAVPVKYEPMGGERYVKLAVQALDRALQLAPKSADAHVDYAAMLWHLYPFDVSEHPDGLTGTRVYKELDTALKLDPENARAKALKQEVDRATGRDAKG